MNSSSSLIGKAIEIINRNLKSKNIVSHMYGLMQIQFVLNAIDVMSFSPDRPQSVSSVVALNTLKNISEYLQFLEQAYRDQVLLQDEIMSSLNVPYCCESIVTSLIEICERLIHQVNINPYHYYKDCYQMILSKMKLQFQEVKNTLSYKFYSLNAGVTSSDNFHFTTASTDDGTSILPETFIMLLDIFKNLPFHQITFLKAVNSPMLEKVSQNSMAEIIESSTDPICQICHSELIGATAISFLPNCNHVCCQDCMWKWLMICFNARQPW